MAIERTNSNVWVEDRLQKQSVFPSKSVFQGPQLAQQAFPASSSREQEQKLTRLETLAKQAKGARVSFPGSSRSHTLFSPTPPPPALRSRPFYHDDDDDYYYHSGAPASAKRAWDRVPYPWNMVNLFSFGCHVIDRAYVRTYASTDFMGGVGETIKRKGGVSQACLGKPTSLIQDINNVN